MQPTQYESMLDEIKRELDQMFDNGHLDGLIAILDKYHRNDTKATCHAQIMISSECIKPNETRNTMNPLALLTTGSDSKDNYSGVAFGVMPSGTIYYEA